MKKINQYIKEGLKIGSKTKVNQRGTFSDEELRHDYTEVGGAYTKAEKDVFKDKYGINSNKIRDIQLEILDHLRDNRNKKTKFNEDDINDFLRYDLPMKYENIEKYFEKESNKFLESVLEYYKNRAKKINPNPSRQSYNDRYVLIRIKLIKKYLNIS